MVKIVFLAPPSKNVIIRDVYYGCWHERNWIDYYWPPTYMEQLNATMSDSVIVDSYLLNNDASKVLGKLKNLQPEFVVINSSAFTIDADISFLKKLKSKIHPKIIIYGDYVTLYPKELIQNKDVDFVIRGEPDEVINKLITNADNIQLLKSLPGVCFKGFISHSVAKASNLDDLPIPNRNIKTAHKYLNPFALSIPFTTMLVSRGCKFNCSFCTVPLIYGNSFRRKSVNKVVNELIKLKSGGYNEIFFRDENLTYDKTFVSKLCKEIIKHNVKIDWMCNSRVDTANFNLLKLMKQAGCHLIKFGVESGNQEILDSVDKKISLDQIRQTFEWCNKLDIETVAHFIIGLPGETKKSIMNTINFAIDIDPFYASFDILRKYPSTKFYNKKVCDLSENELANYRNLAFRKFYLRPKLIFKHLFHLKSLNQFKNKLISTFRLWCSFMK